MRHQMQQLQSQKNFLQQQILGWERRMRAMEQLYKASSERAPCGLFNGRRECMEIESLRQQLDAVILLKDVLNTENGELQRRIQAAEQERDSKKEFERNACVICMDDAATVVCLPCKHLVLCPSCMQQCDSCPLCRRAIDEKLHIFIP